MTLTELLARIRVVLMDVDSLVWDDDTLTEAVKQALDDYNAVHPVTISTILTLTAAGKEIDLSTLTGFNDLLRVDWPYVAGVDQPADAWQAWYQYWDAGTPMVALRTDTIPQVGDKIRLLYIAQNSIEDLNGATSTTIDPRHEGMLVRGSAAYAAKSRAIDRAEGFKNDPKVTTTLSDWGRAELRDYASELNKLKVRGWSGLGSGRGWNVDR
jgi:hypothetical protein